MSRATYRPEAKDDIAAIRRYYRGIKPTAGRKIIADIRKQVRLVGRFPRIGRDRSDLRPNLRCTYAGKYLIFFRPLKKGAEILRVIHLAMHITPSMFPP
jgi:toxin ParE1/3/4